MTVANFFGKDFVNIKRMTFINIAFALKSTVLNDLNKNHSFYWS